MSEHQLHIAITDDASLDHPVAHHSGWLAMRYGPEFDGFATQWIRNEVSLEDIADPYRCQTRPEHWDGYCAPRFTRAMMRKICADTDRAPCGPLERTGPPRGRHRGDRDAIRPQRCLPNQDGHYRPGAFRWPWTEYTGRDTAQVNEFVRTVRWHYERKAESWTVLAADRGWRVKVIDVLPTPSPRKAPPLQHAQ
ncbi:hypothetical protein AB0L50_36610 [Streptomyces flaveolus]|uniref:hypothetical protein n=1 Tax=Streptomyces flaveolus TaxID=67297 RepID=UPI003442B4E8